VAKVLDATTESLELLTGYDESISAAVEEVEACGASDSISMSVYIVEPGRSTKRLLSALRSPPSSLPCTPPLLCIVFSPVIEWQRA